MKKNLIALAILGAFSGAALAQSNVTLYGIVDVDFQYNDPEVPVRPPRASTAAINRVAAGVSRFGSAVTQPERGVHARGRFRHRRGYAKPRWPFVRSPSVGGRCGQMGNCWSPVGSDVFIGHRYVSTLSGLPTRSGPAGATRRWARRSHPLAPCGWTTRCCISRPPGVASGSAPVIRLMLTGPEVPGSGNNTRVAIAGA